MERSILYLSHADVVSVGPTMVEIIQVLEVAFRDKGEGHVEMPPKPGIHPQPDAFIHAMPAYIPSIRAAGVKWVSGYPENRKRGLPTISGLLILNDPETGLPLAVMDCVWITAQRTAAASAVAAKFLARPNSRSLGILGCGVQGRSHLEALGVLFRLERVMAYDTDPAAGRRFATEMSRLHNLQVTIVDQPREAVVGCDLVVTAGPILRSPHRTIQPGWLEAGSFASLVDFDSYWHPDAFRQIDKFCTDDVSQLEYYRKVGYFQHIPAIHADLGELVTQRKPGRANETERTMTCNLGLALGDMATAMLIYQRALQEKVGTWLPL